MDRGREGGREGTVMELAGLRSLKETEDPQLDSTEEEKSRAAI